MGFTGGAHAQGIVFMAPRPRPGTDLGSSRMTLGPRGTPGWYPSDTPKGFESAAPGRAGLRTSPTSRSDGARLEGRARVSGSGWEAYSPPASMMRGVIRMMRSRRCSWVLL